MFKDLGLILPVGFLLALGVIILSSIAPNLFPSYFIYIFVSLAAFWFFSQLDFEVILLFKNHFYVVAIVLLVLTLLIGRITNNAIRWIPIGSFSLQPSEIVRPLLLVFFAGYLTEKKLSLIMFIKSLVLMAIPTFLILIQPSLSVSLLTVVSFFGVLIASNFNKKYLLIGLVMCAVFVPLFWQVMAPYQKSRLESFLNPGKDPLGAGYNSIQSTIAAGSGEIFGRGLGKGIQTQLSFLPEKQTDFIFAAISEELGFFGSFLALLATFTILYRIIKYMENAVSPSARAYLSGFFLVYLIQIFIHVGMNMGMLPVTGLPYPLLSAGGSSLLATMIGLGIAVGTYKR